MSKLSDALRVGGDFVKPETLVGQVVTVVSFEPGEYEYRGKMVPKADIKAVTSEGEEIDLSGTGTMCKNLQAAIAQGFELPLDLRIVAFQAGANTGYGFNDPSED
jgi:hypothetical protein